MRSPELEARDLDACVAMMRGGSRTFFAASRLLPVRVRSAAIALYAFCRVADDLVDQGGDVQAHLAQLRDRLDRIYATTPGDSVEDQALAIVVQQHQLPRPFLDALIDGFEWDTDGRRYRTLEELHGYAARVAGTVGAMMSWIMGARHPGTLARACELGVAMQLTNIARDVGEDARNGRIYLPLDWFAEAGIDREVWLAAPQASPPLRALVGRLLDEADRLYRRAASGIAELPPDCRAAILAASTIYAEIGHQLRAEGLDSVGRRTVVGTGRKLVLLAAAWTQAGWIYADARRPEPLEGIRFLVESAAQATASPVARGHFPNRAPPQRIEWVIGLLERLEGEKRGRRPARLPSRA